jgi:hypothetical protein
MTSREDAVVDLIWRGIRTALEEERARISGEIGSYPPPIPACDEQFNYLLEKRDRVSSALARLRRAAGGAPSLAACRSFIEESSGLIGAEPARRLRAQLRDSDPQQA